MTRNPRLDLPGSWHHVMNRGIARRSLFESREDIRFFLSCLARAVRRGQIEVHAWTVLTTHFHLLVRSPRAELPEAMRRVQNSYVRRFNRSRRRDGPMVRGRFSSRPVRTSTYRRVLVRYFDDNPVRAGLVQNPSAYPFGSAHAYARHSGPPWLTRCWIEDLVRSRLGVERYDGRLYSLALASSDRETVRAIVERRLAMPANMALQGDDLDHLVRAAPSAIREWMRRRAELADESHPGLPVASPESIRKVIAEGRRKDSAWTIHPNRKVRCGWDVLEAGLLRDLSAATYREVGLLIGGSADIASRVHHQHRHLQEHDEKYSEVAARIAREVLDRVL